MLMSVSDTSNFSITYIKLVFLETRKAIRLIQGVHEYLVPNLEKIIIITNKLKQEH